MAWSIIVNVHRSDYLSLQKSYSNTSSLQGEIDLTDALITKSFKRTTLLRQESSCTQTEELKNLKPLTMRTQEWFESCVMMKQQSRS